MFESTFISGDTSKTSAIVLSVVALLLGRGQTMWMDNFYSAPALAQKLKSMKTDSIRILSLGRKDVPKIVKDKNLKITEQITQHSDPIFVIKWHDKKNVIMISTYHGDETQNGDGKRKSRYKSYIILVTEA
jgi:hypothetical protein